MADAAGRDRPISVFLLDGHDPARQALRDVLADQPDIDVAGEAASVTAALTVLPMLAPDVALLDVRLPDGDGMSVCRHLRGTLPGTACLLLLMPRGDDIALAQSVMAGAAGAVLKHAGSGDLIDAIRTAASGLSALDVHAARMMIGHFRAQARDGDPIATLTPQEGRVLRLIGAGLTNRQIAGCMSLSEKTVKNYVGSLLSKLGMHRRAQAAALVARSGWT